MCFYHLLLGFDLRCLLMFILIFLLVAECLKNRNPPNYPPGPLALPFVGNLFRLDINITELADVHGNVFHIHYGRQKMVFVCSYKMVKEAFLTQAENFVDRAPSVVYTRFFSGQTNGLIMTNGEPWKTQRRFALSTMRNFGVGKNLMEQNICEEARHLLEEIERHNGKPFTPAGLFNNAASNIICQLVMGRRFEYSDHNFVTVLKNLSEFFRLVGSKWFDLYEVVPGIMKHLPGPHNKMFSLFNNISDFISEEVKRHKRDLDPNNPRDYIDSFLIEMKNHSEDNQSFNDKNLVLCAMDLFLAGTETTASTLQWALIYLIKNPDVQEKVHAEIDQVIGRTRLPTMADRANLPYTDAVIHEIQRMANISPFSIPTVAAKDTQLGGYSIPKGTCVIILLTSVLFDKNEWETPHTFNPGHFLDASGKFLKKEAFLPFSAGKRMCLGEGLARMEIFLFLIALLQKFSFSAPHGEELRTDGILGDVLVPHSFNVHAKAR
ncbi:cytochrome P450 2J6-like [Dunckerocampus dactyliophorus]|uniref:cytochrome P450 2J6-like n=1 Tax=Dunckerocampus dactyliophorus TaxID=161453 RepID=UPI002404CF5D|nr:cytochrome P450 2J6-like [Dunckerocampus dactyliophorus]